VTTAPKNPQVSQNVSVWVAVLALVVSIFALVQQKAETQQGQSSNETAASRHRDSRLRSILESGVVRVGYGSFPPYTVVEVGPPTRVTGFSADVVEEIAKRAVPPLKVEWQSFSWDALKADVESGRFDFVADPVFQTIPRAAEFDLTTPYSYFGIAVGLVRSDDKRFLSFADLDRADIEIALAEGWTSSEYARQILKKPKFKSIPVTGDAFNQLDEVLTGRVDVALNDVPTVIQYARAHAGRVTPLWIDTPPSKVPGGFLLRKGDQELRDFLNSAIRILIADGTIDRIDRKWKSFGYLPAESSQPGSGLRE
jgi:ABC-type amino acid transport substrate-binding protein